MKKTAYFVLGSVAALAVLVVGALTVSAAQQESDINTDTSDRPMWGHMMRGEGGLNEEHRAEMDSLLQVGNYDAWKAAMETHATEMGKDTPPMLEQVTAENFDRFVEMHNLMKAGDRDGAKAIADELGLKEMGLGRGGKMMKGFGDREFKDVNGDGVCNHVDMETEVQVQS
ncbi:MAG TPA: hypothetical protein DCS29_00220 [Candidatus Magasanikbacteria bacterium]|nr:MAG: hypothetical protein A2479_03255 [Candidatus Magasanikbacteria bacterium RIFOXYC2_FULL_39_8]HAT03190.1 hypothetical protein [Candidatus Magasanikbacteria bacterium]